MNAKFSGVPGRARQIIPETLPGFHFCQVLANVRHSLKLDELIRYAFKIMMVKAKGAQKSIFKSLCLIYQKYIFDIPV